MDKVRDSLHHEKLYMKTHTNQNDTTKITSLVGWHSRA